MNDTVYVNLSLKELIHKAGAKYGHLRVDEDEGLKTSLEDAAVALVAYNIFSETDCMDYLADINDTVRELMNRFVEGGN